MEKRVNRDPTVNMQKKLVESRRTRWSMPEPESEPVPEPVPDITDLMNDWFYGNGNKDHKRYDLTSETLEDDRSGDSSKFTHEEWLQEAKRMVASSPSRHSSASRLVGSPRFAAAQRSEFAPQSPLDRRDPLSRSARRHRSMEGFSGEILSKSATHTHNKSESFEQTVEKSPAAAVQQWFTNILKPNNGVELKQGQSSQAPDELETNQTPRQSTRRKSRFRDDPSAGQASLPKPVSRRTFKTQPIDLENPVLSPPKNLIESAHRRSISSSTCSFNKFSKWDSDADQPRQLVAELRLMEEVGSLNLFLKEQRAAIGRISRGEIPAKAKVILSGSSNSTSSMVAAVSYAWLLGNKEKKDEEGEIVVPVMNMKRRRMWKQRQAAWLLHHVGIDVKSLLFSDEVDLDSLIMAMQLNVQVVDQDILKTNGEVGSPCTLLTDNYCEEAYDLLDETPSLRKLLLAGILLDTHNLNFVAKLSTNRDAEAVQLLLVGFPPSLRHELYDQLMQDPKDDSFLEVLRANYGKPPSTRYEENGEPMEHRASVRKSTSNSYQQMNRPTSGIGENGAAADFRYMDSPGRTSTPGSMKTKSPLISGNMIQPSVPSPVPSSKNKAESPNRPKNKFFLAKWFGFGSK